MTEAETKSGILRDADVWSGGINIAGWRRGGAGERSVVEPATGAVLGMVGLASVEDVDRAAARAVEAQKEWAARKPEDRAAVLRRAGQLWEEHAGEVGDWIVREAGSVPAKAGLEVHTAAAECFEGAALSTAPAGEVLATNEERWSFARRRPVGVVSVIAPFNFPLILAIRAVAPALALGNAVLLKPDPRTAVSGGVSIMRIFEDAGLPQGLLSLLPGGADVGAALVEHPAVRVIAFTGSTRAGRIIGETAGRLLKRAHLELGGNNAMIVLPGVDLAAAASAAAFGSYLHQGQICMTTGRHLVHTDVYDAYVDALAEKARNLPVGDPAREAVALGPIIDTHERDRIDTVVRNAVDAGARLVAGGQPAGAGYLPTVLADVQPDNPAWRQEIFGPVAPVMRFSTVDEAVALANDSDYGLSASILGDVGMAMQIADRLESGKVHVNEQTVSDEAYAPFGGVKDSGNGGRVGGATANLDAFTETQWVTLRSSIAPYPF